MALLGRRRAAFAVAGLAAMACAALLDRFAPFPSADVTQGSDECFARGGLGERELSAPDRGPQRWTTGRARFRFENLPAGPLRVTVVADGHRSPLVIAADGRILGVIPPEDDRGVFDVPTRRGDGLDVELQVAPFVVRGRHLGTLLRRVEVSHEVSRAPSPRFVLLFVVPALLMVCAALVAGLPAVGALAVAVLFSGLQAMAMVPFGVARSAYAIRLSIGLSLAAILCAVFARSVDRRWRGAGTWALVSLLLAFEVHVVAGASPLMVVSDLNFHLHNLADVRSGDLFPTSLTPGEKPFRFPYGVSFYALLVPLARMGFDPVTLLRHAAALSGVAASAALFVMLAGGGPRRAGLAVIGLQLLPATFAAYSFGNLSNVFGQAMTVFFFGWWTAGCAPWGVGGALLGVGCLAHFSSLIVLVTLCASLVASRGGALGRDRGRLLALAVGLGIAALYYARFAGLVLAQLPRLLEGGGAGGSVFETMLRQARLALAQWGWPAVVLGLLGMPRLRRGGLDADLVAYWLAGAALATVAVVSPLEVRYVHALTLPLAVALGTGAERLLERGWTGRILAALLLSVQTALAGAVIVEGVLHRYRP